MSKSNLHEGASILEKEQYLTFILSGKEFAVPIMRMKEIIRYNTGLTAVPMVPDFICGVINLRGNVVPVFNLAAKFGMPVQEVSKRTCIIITEVDLEGESVVVGIVVDKVLHVLDIPDTEIEPAPAFGSRIRTDFIQGIGRLDERIIIILDVDAVLSAEEIAILGQLQDDKHHAAAVHPDTDAMVDHE